MHLIQENTIFLDIDLNTKEEVLEFIARRAAKAGITTSAKAYAQALAEREKETTTGFGFGIAIPHAKISEIKHAAVIVVRLKNGVEWASLDNQPVQIAIALAAPALEQTNAHLKLLSQIAKRMMHEDFREGLFAAATEKEMFDLLQRNLTEGVS